MVTRMLSLLFGCRHRQLTRPITPAQRPREQPAAAYVACLDCGKQFHYDVHNMRIGDPILAAAPGNPAGSGHFQSQA
jgi:hypothetical protein